MRFLSGVRKKILSAFILAFLTLLAAGVVAFYSLEKVLVTVDQVAVPDKSIALMYDIFTDLSLLNNYNRIYSITNDSKYQSQIEDVAHKVRIKIDSLDLLLEDQPFQRKQVDSLKILIENISEDSKMLAKAKQNANLNDVTARLTKEILDHVKTDTTLFTDSSYVVKKTTSEVKVSDYFIQQIDSLAKTSHDPRNVGFFQKLGFLFSGKRPSALVDTLYLKPEKRIDTLTTVSKDSLLMLSKGEFINKLDSLLNRFYEKENASMSQINAQELNFTRTNNELIEKAWNIILLINRQTIQSTFKEINKASKISNDSKNIILLIILFFVIAGIVLASYVFMDLSKSSYYQEELFQAKKNAEQSAKAKLDFLAKMSHEIRTPLTSILGFANLLKNKDDEYVKIIKNSSQQLLNTANEILDLAKVDNGIIDINNSPFDLQDFLKYLVMDFEMKVQNKGLKFVTEFPEEEQIVVNSDMFRLQQIVTNLLNNALKFTDTGHIKFVVQRGLQRDNNIDIRMVIEDTGSGIKSEDLNKIFEEFKQFGAVSTKKLGFGLGLSIVKKLVHLLGGNIVVKSVPNQGTKFSLNFTFEKAALSEATKRETATSRQILAGKTIMVVDDDPTILKLLKKYNATTVSFDNPDDVKNYFSTKTCDLCLMDLQLSGFSGKELCIELKKYPATESVKIVAFTANLIENNKEELLNAGFDDLIFKPIFEKDLINSLVNMLGIETSSADIKEVEETAPTEESDKVLSIVDRFDFSAIEKFTFGDADLMNEVIDQFIVETEKDFANLKAALKTEDAEAIAKILHRLTSRLQQFGIKDLAAKSREIEHHILQQKNIPGENLSDFADAGTTFIEEAKMTFANS